MRGSFGIALLIASMTPLLAAGQDAPFLESPGSVVETMLELAGVGPSDVVYDLGSGDGRIVITAAVKYAARGVGIEIEPELVELSRENARGAGVADRVEFIEGDLFEADFSEATVLTIYLIPKALRKLGPLMVDSLAPGTPVVSHRYPVQGWTAERRVKVEGRWIYLYRVPETASDVQGAVGSGF